MHLSPKAILTTSILAIAVVFIVISTLFYSQYMEDFIDHERTNQVQLVQIFDQALTRYFKNLKYVVENAVLHPAFDYSQNHKEDAKRFKNIPYKKALLEYQANSMKNVLLSERASGNIEDLKGKEIKEWQIHKGLPEYNSKGEFIAAGRRILSRNILKANKELHYVFEMDMNGDLVFLEPYETQKNISSFNYEFRDYLQLTKQSGQTSLSEGYISHDQNRTQIITMATPIFDNTNKIVKVFAASVSAVTLRNEVFMELSKELSMTDGSTIYLVDRHGHIVASSNGKNIYFPIDGQGEDDNDIGNLRNVGFFKDIDWEPDILEKGNIYERQTKSWSMPSLKKITSGRYVNLSGEDSYGTFYPTAIVGSKNPNWGILVETPMSIILQAKKKVQILFLVSGLILAIVLCTLFVYLMKSFSQLENELSQKENEISDMAAQVAHDIRSPLSAMNAAFQNATFPSEESSQLVKSSIKRMSNISANLLSKTKKQTEVKVHNEQRRPLPVVLLLESIVSEKQYEYSHKLNISISKKIPENLIHISTAVDPTEFKRVLSNIINNSVEAIHSYGEVIVSLRKKGSMAEITVADNGRGIKPEHLSEVTKKNFTFGKAEGSGLGLHHAQEMIDKWEGILHIESQEGQGTEIKILIPTTATLPFYANLLEINSNNPIVIVDDDESIHQLWINKFESLDINAKIYNLHSEDELNQWIQSLKQTKDYATFLVDYRFGTNKYVGTDLITKYKLTSNTYLVTNSSGNKNVLSFVEEFGTKLIPKELITYISVVDKGVKKSSIV